MQISVIGGGYVGLISASCFADLGHNVTIIEIDPNKVDLINRAVPPIFERGLQEILEKNIGTKLVASTSYDSVPESDLSLICVGTPQKEDGSADLNYIISASKNIGEALVNSSGYHVVTVKSTVPPGTTFNHVITTVLSHSGKKRSELGFCMNPEFLREGRAVEDFISPDRIVIGSETVEAGDVIEKAYSKLNAPILRTGLTAAEMIKYASNSLLATKISFSNEIGNMCKELGIDVYEVMKGVGMDHRISPNFLNAGCGFGGSCFPKDVAALAALSKSLGLDPVLLNSVLEVNERQPHRMLELLEKRMGTLEGKKVAVLGLAFKDFTDDIRESRAIPIISHLLCNGAEVSVYDPLAMDNMKRIFPQINYCSKASEALEFADACLVVTEWPEFSQLSEEFELMKTKIIIDGRKVIHSEYGEGICW